MITIEEYREYIGDTKSSDELIKQKIDYLSALCRNMAKMEITSCIKGSKSGSDNWDFEEKQ